MYCEKTFKKKTDIKMYLIPETLLDENEEEEQCNALETKEGKYKLRIFFLCIIAIIYYFGYKKASKPSTIPCAWNIKQYLYALNSI